MRSDACGAAPGAEAAGRWLDALDGVAARDLRTTTRVLERLWAMFEEGPPTGGCEALDKAPQEGSQAPN